MERLKGRTPAETEWIPPVVIDNFPPITLPDRNVDRPLFLETEAAISSLGDDSQQLFKEMLWSREFMGSVGKVKGFLTQRINKNPQARADIRGQLVGFLFEQLAYYLLREKIGDNERLVSPGDTFKFYRLLYNTRRVIQPPYGFSLGLDGITVPDGMILARGQDTTQIIGVCEYSLASDTNRNRKRKQSEYYESRAIFDHLSLLTLPFKDLFLRDYVHSRYSDFPPRLSVGYQDFKIIYVVPGDENGLTDNLRRQIIKAPFSGKEFNQVFRGIFLDVENSL